MCYSAASLVKLDLSGPLLAWLLCELSPRALTHAEDGYAESEHPLGSLQAMDSLVDTLWQSARLLVPGEPPVVMRTLNAGALNEDVFLEGSPVRGAEGSPFSGGVSTGEPLSWRAAARSRVAATVASTTELLGE